VAQLYQGTTPKRNSIDDFRLTLPDGGTLYYEKSTGKWILAAKSKVEIGTGNVSSTQVPTISSSSPAARKEDGTISNSQLDVKYWAFIKAFFSVVEKVSTYPEPGNGAPLIFHQALMAAFKGVGEPTEMKGKISEGSGKVVIG